MAINNSKSSSYWTQKAAPWVSHFVLLGCVIITVGLVYVSKEALRVAEGLSGEVNINILF